MKDAFYEYLISIDVFYHYIVSFVVVREKEVDLNGMIISLRYDIQYILYEISGRGYLTDI